MDSGGRRTALMLLLAIIFLEMVLSGRAVSVWHALWGGPYALGAPGKSSGASVGQIANAIANGAGGGSSGSSGAGAGEGQSHNQPDTGGGGRSLR